MRVTLDGQDLFDQSAAGELEIEPASFRRDSIERTMAGLDGVLSIDLGERSRQIKQKGVLRAKSRTQLNERISAISGYMDGKTHTLITGNGEKFENLRMDVFKVSKERTGGASIDTDYEIVYTQLKVW